MPIDVLPVLERSFVSKRLAALQGGSTGVLQMHAACKKLVPDRASGYVSWGSTRKVFRFSPRSRPRLKRRSLICVQKGPAHTLHFLLCFGCLDQVANLSYIGRSTSCYRAIDSSVSGAIKWLDRTSRHFKRGLERANNNDLRRKKD